MDIISSALGSAASAMVARPKTVLDCVLSFLSGALFGFYIGGAVSEYFNFGGSRIGDGIVFFWAVFGSGAASALMGEIGPIFKAVFQKYLSYKE